ncbi:hypothetical protein KA001_02195 [Patescibacteria group bacterium]|nr:hypothetical protein [Patescibacteria group bacterium]
MKIIVIGPSLSGKTTIIRLIRETTNLVVSEIDEELTRLNNNQYPTDNDYKHKILTPTVINNVLNMPQVIFFTNTDYFTIPNLQLARAKGFKIIQLKLSLQDLEKRNAFRVKNEGYSDLSEWLSGMLKYQSDVENSGLFDKTIDASKPTIEIVDEILKT